MEIIVWLVVWNINFIFLHIGNFIIPIDELIFFRRFFSTTNQIVVIVLLVVLSGIDLIGDLPSIESKKMGRLLWNFLLLSFPPCLKNLVMLVKLLIWGLIWEVFNIWGMDLY